MDPDVRKNLPSPPVALYLDSFTMRTMHPLPPPAPGIGTQTELTRLRAETDSLYTTVEQLGSSVPALLSRPSRPEIHDEEDVVFGCEEVTEAQEKSMEKKNQTRELGSNILMKLSIFLHPPEQFACRER